MKVLRSVLIVALLFLSGTACWGGAMIIAEARGNPLGLMPQSALVRSLFLGIVLFVAIGVPGVWVLWVNLRHEPTAGLWSALEGAALLGWLTAEGLSSQALLWPHYMCGALALFFIFSGVALSQSRSRTSVQHGDSRERFAVVPTPFRDNETDA